MAPLGWSVELVIPYWTMFWWSCTIGRGDAGLGPWKEVRAEGVGPGKEAFGENKPDEPLMSAF